MKQQIKLANILLVIFLAFSLNAQVHDDSWRNIIQKNEGTWFATQEAKQIAGNVLLYQRDIGGWPKNVQMHHPLSKSQKQELLIEKRFNREATTDNGATLQEMLFLSKMYANTQDETYKKAFLKGLDYIIEAQYENGGWPQFYPLKKGYYSHITYNDDSMVNILNLLKNIKDNTEVYSIKPSDETINKIEIAFNKGVDCILKTQYKQNGVLTAWCAQHQVKSLQPAKARAYELPSLSGKESAKIVLLLMSIEKPSKEISIAIESAVDWFDTVKLTGIKQEYILDKAGKFVDRKIVADENADPLWARFMELDDNKPFFCDRDGIKKATLAEISIERRSGYAWYTNEPKQMFKQYAKWKGKNHVEPIEIRENTAPEDEYNMVVAKDGSGDFTTIQEAINAAKAFPYQRVHVNIKNGVYHEKVHVYSWNTHLTLIGESKAHTIITFDDYFNKIDLGRNSTFHTSTVLIEGDDFIAKNLTIKNTSGPVGQAVAISVNANRCYFENCSFLGNQDTVYTAGEGFKQYFKNCYVEGSTDFIFGEATALFESCVIHSKSNSYITAASTPESQYFGYVFKDCRLTADENVTDVYLGRPWRLYAKTVFLNCEMHNHIKPEGWNNWSKQEAESSAFYAEYNCSGEGSKPESRVRWSHQLKKREAKKYTIENILKSNTNWYLNL